MSQRLDFQDGPVQVLADQDPRLEPLLVAVLHRVGQEKGLVGGRPRKPVEALLRAVVGQQLSGAAASTIFSRVLAALPGRAVTTAGVLALPESALRSAGLSAMKVRFVRNICSAIECGALDLAKVSEMADSDAAAALQVVSGIGEWTASMYLIFQLRRPDILPCLDVGVQRGLQLAYGLKERPTAEYVMRVGERWRPVRTLACRFLWTALNEGLAVDDIRAARASVRAGERSS